MIKKFFKKINLRNCGKRDFAICFGTDMSADACTRLSAEQ